MTKRREEVFPEPLGVKANLKMARQNDLPI